MKIQTTDEQSNTADRAVEATVFPIIIAISFSHMLNDAIQSLIPATYPLMKESLRLNFAEVGLITFTFQCTASLLQPLVGLAADRRPLPYSLPAGMGFTLVGLVLLSLSHAFGEVLLSVGLVGMGSSVFHPESSRVAYMAAGKRRGLAQSVFQVGGNFGASLGPLLAAAIVTRLGQSHILWFSIAALAGIVVLTNVGRWYSRNLARARRPPRAHELAARERLTRSRVAFAIAVLLVLIFSKYFYLASMTSYYTFYLIDKFHVTVSASQVLLFVFLFAVAAGTVIGGPIGDRFGRKYVIWGSILGTAPFSLALPYAGLLWTVVLSIFVGLILSSAFSAIIVYAQELIPGKVGMISGLFFGFAFGMGGIGSAVLGLLADRTSIGFVYHVCAFLPLIGLLTAFLPNIEGKRTAPKAA